MTLYKNDEIIFTGTQIKCFLETIDNTVSVYKYGHSCNRYQEITLRDVLQGLFMAITAQECEGAETYAINGTVYRIEA